MKKNTTKRSLLASVLALALCVIMLVGTTFAWFTDTASTSVNRIQAGNLKVGLQVKENGEWVDAEGMTLQFKKAAGAAAEEAVLWEPGCTYDLPELRVVNNGNLALKFYLLVTGVDGDSELLDVIEWEMTAYGGALGFPDLDAEVVELLPGRSWEFKLSGHMLETAGNEYQGKSIDGIGITVYATQDTVESDSFGPTYDEDAEYAVATAPVTVADNKVVGDVVMRSVEKTADDQHVAVVTVPNGAAVNDGVKNLSLTIVETDKPANFEVAVTDDHTTMEVKVEGLAANNDQLIQVEMFVGKDLTNFKMYHNGVDMTQHYSMPATPADQDYCYNSSTGVVTMWSKSFSPFTYTYGKESWSNHVAESYATPVDEANKVVTIASAEELALLAQQVNSGTSYAKYTVNLTKDIDLGSFIWKPIGQSNAVFQGIFDGQGHTISNLLVGSTWASDVGLFGVTKNGEVKNLTVKNAVVKGYLDVGVVAGTPYTSKYTNIKVCGDVTVDGYAYVGGVFGKNAYANLTDITVDVNAGSYVKANSYNYRTYVGGVVGFMGEGAQVVKNVKSNIDVFGSTCDVGGITGIAHYGNSFVNCSSSGNVTLVNCPDDGLHLEIGGIAGVWHNQNGTTVTFDGCSFTGTLSTHLNGEDKSADVAGNNITGRAYGAGTGTLIIK